MQINFLTEGSFVLYLTNFKYMSFMTEYSRPGLVKINPVVLEKQMLKGKFINQAESNIKMSIAE